MSDDVPLAMAWVGARSLRLADGPDEVHQGMVARLELGRQYRALAIGRRVRAVTGAARGLGAALTAAFRDRGDEVLATDLDGDGST